MSTADGTLASYLKCSLLTTPCLEKNGTTIFFRHNLDNKKYIVVIFAQNIVKVMRNQTNTTKVRHC